MIYILVPIHNRKETTLKFIKSFSKQTYKDYQVVIVDDGSTDGSSEAIKTIFPNVIILKGDGNLWWTGSMNKGLKYILSIAKNTDYLLAINDDVTVKDNYIEKLISASKKNDNSIVGSLYVDSLKRGITYDSGVKIDWKHYIYNQIPYDQNRKIVGNIDTLATRGALIPIDTIIKVGIFEKKLRHYGADYEYFFRAKKLGFQLYMSYEAVVYGEEDAAIIGKQSSRIQSISSVWKKNFSIKSPTNIYNHLFIIWNYCPSWKYKFKNICVLIGYNSLLFVCSVFLYPFKSLLSKTN